ncbi:MAG: glycosyltransferase family 2 protein [Mycobacterium leprae]
MGPFRVLVGIPAYNEADSLEPLMQKLDDLYHYGGLHVEVLFVDDGSRDATLEMLQKAAAERSFLNLIRHPRNQGLGAAMNTILGYAVSHLESDDVLVTMDGDNTHDPAHVPAMIDRLKQQGLDLVIASRFVPGGREFGLSLYRKLLSRGASLFFRLFFPIPGVRDFSSGYRAYRIGFLRKAMLRWGQLVTVPGFECMAEILAKCSRLGPKVAEYPLVLHYELKHGPSKMRILRTIGGYIALLRKVG